MFLITCIETGTPMLRGTRAITAVRQTPHGVELLATCTCGATVHLRRGVQVSHGPALAAVGAEDLGQMRGISV